MTTKPKAPAKLKKHLLNPKQEMFCTLYASDREFFGNGTQAYIEAYNIDVKKKGAYDGARASAYGLLTNPHILVRINELLESAVLNDEFVDKQLAFLISQNADMKTKIAAIKEYNGLKQRVTKKIDANLTGDLSVALVEFVGDDN